MKSVALAVCTFTAVSYSTVCSSSREGTIIKTSSGNFRKLKTRDGLMTSLLNRLDNLNCRALQTTAHILNLVLPLT